MKDLWKNSGRTIYDTQGITNEWIYNNKTLYRYLEDRDFYNCPASREHHGAQLGGLYVHSLNVTHELLNLTEKLELTWERPESPFIVGMLHDICKTDDYIYEAVPFPDVEINKEKMFPGHGEKSLIMLAGVIDLTEEEKHCIRYHMGAFVDSKEWPYYSRAVRRYPNVLWTHTADMVASQIIEN